jgi:DNA-binding SARP family transcriptional activator
MTLSASPGRDPASEEAPVPHAIAQALDLASEGHCDEAERQVETYTTDHPKKEASGAGWLEAARCYAKKGDIKAAREMAEKALEIPACESEARVFLDSLPSFPPGR